MSEKRDDPNRTIPLEVTYWEARHLHWYLRHAELPRLADDVRGVVHKLDRALEDS